MLGFFSRGRIASHSLRAGFSQGLQVTVVGLATTNKKSLKQIDDFHVQSPKTCLIFHGSLQGDLEISMEIFTLGPQVNGYLNAAAARPTRWRRPWAWQIWWVPIQEPTIVNVTWITVPHRYRQINAYILRTQMGPFVLLGSSALFLRGLTFKHKGHLCNTRREALLRKKPGLLDVEIKNTFESWTFQSFCMKEQTNWETMKDLHSDTKTATRKLLEKGFCSTSETQKKQVICRILRISVKLRFFMPDFRCKKKHPKHLTGATVPPQSASCCAFWLLCPTRREAKHRGLIHRELRKEGIILPKKNHRKCGGREDHLQKLMKLIWGFPRMVVPNNHGFSY